MSCLSIPRAEKLAVGQGLLPGGDLLSSSEGLPVVELVQR